MTRASFVACCWGSDEIACWSTSPGTAWASRFDISTIWAFVYKRLMSEQGVDVAKDSHCENGYLILPLLWQEVSQSPCRECRRALADFGNSVQWQWMNVWRWKQYSVNRWSAAYFVAKELRTAQQKSQSWHRWHEPPLDLEKLAGTTGRLEGAARPVIKMRVTTKKCKTKLSLLRSLLKPDIG